MNHHRITIESDHHTFHAEPPVPVVNPTKKPRLTLRRATEGGATGVRGRQRAQDRGTAVLRKDESWGSIEAISGTLRDTLWLCQSYGG